MFAVIKTGGKQYRVAAADVIEVEKLAGAAGDSIAFDEVLMVGGDDGVTVGSPLVAGATVAGEIVGQDAPARFSSSRSAAGRIPSAATAIART